MLNKNILINYLLPWIIKKIIPLILLFPTLINLVSFIAFFAVTKHFSYFDSNIIGLILSFFLYSYYFISNKTTDKYSKIIVVIIFVSLIFPASFFVNSYNESFNRLIIISKDKIDLLLVFLYLLSIFSSFLIPNMKDSDKYPKNEISLSEKEFVHLYKNLIGLFMLAVFIAILLFNFFFTNNFKLKSSSCNVISDCPPIEKNESGNWNCENICEENRCLVKCMQKKNVVIQKEGADLFPALFYIVYGSIFGSILFIIIITISNIKNNKRAESAFIANLNKISNTWKGGIEKSDSNDFKIHGIHNEYNFSILYDKAMYARGERTARTKIQIQHDLPVTTSLFIIKKSQSSLFYYNKYIDLSKLNILEIKNEELKSFAFMSNNQAEPTKIIEKINNLLLENITVFNTLEYLHIYEKGIEYEMEGRQTDISYLDQRLSFMENIIKSLR